MQQDQYSEQRLERRFQIAHEVAGGMLVRHLAGEEPQATLFYVHGLGESGLCFERLIADPRLRHFDHLAVDLVGYGKSPWSLEALSLEEQARRLAEYLSSGRHRPIVILGHSMGGVIGTYLCERLPDTFRAFVNIEGNISPPDCVFSGRAARHSLAEWLRTGNDDLLDALYRDEQESPAVIRPYCASIQMCDPRAFHANARELVEISGREVLAGRMAALDLPKVYIFGAPRGAGDQSRGLLAAAGVEMIGIPDAGHWPFLDQDDAFVNELLGFMGRLTGDA